MSTAIALTMINKYVSPACEVATNPDARNAATESADHWSKVPTATTPRSSPNAICQPGRGNVFTRSNDPIDCRRCADACWPIMIKLISNAA